MHATMGWLLDFGASKARCVQRQPRDQALERRGDDRAFVSAGPGLCGVGTSVSSEHAEEKRLMLVSYLAGVDVFSEPTTRGGPV